MPSASLLGKQHHHGCIECRRRYVCACRNLEIDRRCNACISGRNSVGAQAWDPHPCCFENARPCDRYDREKYKLVGPTWYVCTRCARQFPCLPEQVRTHV